MISEMGVSKKAEALSVRAPTSGWLKSAAATGFLWVAHREGENMDPK